MGTMSPFSNMAPLNVTLGVMFLLGAIAFIVIGALATSGKLPGNNVIGLRVQEVRSNEATWVQAHRVVGPFWILAGVALAMGAAFALIAHGWMWLAPVIALLAAGVALAIGGNFGAKTAALVDVALHTQANDQSSTTHTGTPSADPTNGTGGDTAPPAVDLDAMRKAAGTADEQE